MIRLVFKPLGFLSVWGITLICVGSANAQNLIVNGSFEQGVFTDTGAGYDRLLVGSTAMTGWTVVTNEIVWGGPSNGDQITAPDGQYFLDLTSYGRINPIGGVSQSITTVPGTLYHFSFTLFNPVDSSAFSVEANAGSTSMTLTHSGGFDFTATSGSTPITIVGNEGGFFVGIDNVRITAVPAPSTLITLLIGAVPGAAVLLRRRRK